MSRGLPSTRAVRQAFASGRIRHVDQGPVEAKEAFDRWLAAHDAEVAAKAWDEGRLAEELAWHHVLDGHPVPEGEMCDECAVANPYRKAVQS